MTKPMTEADLNYKAVGVTLKSIPWTAGITFAAGQVVRVFMRISGNTEALTGGWFPQPLAITMIVITAVVAVAAFFLGRFSIREEEQGRIAHERNIKAGKAKYLASRQPLIDRTKELSAKAKTVIDALQVLGNPKVPAYEAATAIRDAAVSVRNKLTNFSAETTDEANRKLLDSTALALDMLAPQVAELDRALALTTQVPARALPVGHEPDHVEVDYAPAAGYLQPPNSGTIEERHDQEEPQTA